jgi:hypothetical protein
MLSNSWVKEPLLGKSYDNTDCDMFSIGPTQGYMRRYSDRSKVETNVEARLNTSIMTLRVVGGNRKGSLKSESKIWLRIPRDSDPRRAVPAAYTKDRTIILSERAPRKNQDRNCQTVIKGLDTKAY